MKVFDAELFVIKQVIYLISKWVSFQIEDIWIFSNSQAAIKRIVKSRVKASQVYIKDIQKLAESINTNINIYIHWIPGYINIYRNDQTDKAVKKETEIQSSSSEAVTSLSYIKKKITKESLLE